jgi:hypothetical protein
MDWEEGKREAARKRTEKTGEAAAERMAEGKATPQEVVGPVAIARSQGAEFGEGRGRPPGFLGWKGVGNPPITGFPPIGSSRLSSGG